MLKRHIRWLKLAKIAQIPSGAKIDDESDKNAMHNLNVPVTFEQHAELADAD